LVPVDDPRERLLERLVVERAADPERAGAVEGRRAWLPQLEEPEPLLTERERRGGPVGAAWDRQAGGVAPATGGALEELALARRESVGHGARLRTASASAATVGAARSAWSGSSP